MKDLTCGVLLAVAMMLVSASARAALCPKCSRKMFTADIGKCVECGGHTTSGSHKLCPKCSRRLGRCEHCRAKLKGGPRPVKPNPKPDKPKKPKVKVLADRRHGNWRHRFLILNPSSRSRVTGGQLWFDGKQLLPKQHAGWMWTPWGKAVYFKQRLKRGWMLGDYRGRTIPDGKEIESPDPKASEKVNERYEELRESADAFTLDLRYVGESGKPFYNLVLSAPGLKRKEEPFEMIRLLDGKQVLRLIDCLTYDGFLARAGNIAGKEIEPPKGPAYTLTVSGPNGLELYEDLGWDLAMLKRLDALRKPLGGEPAKAMDRLLGRMSGLRKKWRKASAAKPGPE
ncbi:MAG: hypothetical protein R6V58_13080 [Planctomycetota bacterium]